VNQSFSPEKRPGKWLWIGIVLLCATGGIFVFSSQQLFPQLNKNLIINGSFEKKLVDWGVKNNDFQRISARKEYTIMPGYLEHDLSFELLPIQSPGVAAPGQSTLTLNVSACENKIHANYVVNIFWTLDSKDKSDENNKWGWSKYIITPDNYADRFEQTIGKRKSWELRSVMDFYKSKYSKNPDSPLTCPDDKTPFSIDKASLAISNQRGSVEVSFDHHVSEIRPVGMKPSLLDFNIERKTGISYIQKFQYIPSEGNYFVRSGTLVNEYIYQKITNLIPGREYLLFFSSKMEQGLSAPIVGVYSLEGESLKSRMAPGRAAQTGWVKTGMVFIPGSETVVLRVGDFDKKKNAGRPFINNYDDFHLHLIPKLWKAGFLDQIQARFGVMLEEDLVRPKSIDYSRLMDESFKEALEAEYKRIDLPIYDLYFDEYDVWASDKVKEPVVSAEPRFFGYRFKGGYRNGYQVRLVKDGREMAVRYKTRGHGLQHHIGKSRSLKLNYTKKEKEYLLNAETRSLISEPLSYFIGQQLGLMALQNDFVYLRINDKPIAVKWRYSRGKKDIEYNGKPEGYLIGETVDIPLNERGSVEWDIHALPSDKKYIQKFSPYEFMGSFTYLLKKPEHRKYLSAIVNHEKFLRWMAHNIIVNSCHQGTSHNHLFYFNSADGLLEPLPWDINMGNYPVLKNTRSVVHYNSAIDNFLKDFPNYLRRNQIIWEYISDDKKVSAALHFHDKSFTRVKEEFRINDHFAIGSSLKFPWENVKARLNNPKVVLNKSIKTLKNLLQESNFLTATIRNLDKLPTSKYSGFKAIEISLRHENSMSWSSSSLDNVVLENIEEAIAFKPEVDGFEKINSRLEKESSRLQLNLVLASPMFFDYQVGLLWPDEWKYLRGRLSGNPEDFQFIRQNYVNGPIQYPKMGPIFYALKSDVEGDVPKNKKLIRLFKETGLVTEPVEKKIYVIYKPRQNFNLQNDIKLEVSNAVTGVKIVPRIVFSEHVSASETDIKMLNPGSLNRAQVSPKEKFPPELIENLWGLSAVLDKRLSGEEFLKKYPYFKKSDEDGVMILPKGSYDIKKNIVVPVDLKIVITPGAKLRFYPGVSLISYSHLVAIGTSEDPIYFTGIQKNQPWGVVAVISKKNRGVFKYGIFDGGGEAYLNGIRFTGMLSAYYSDLEVSNSIFRNASIDKGDDSINAKYGTAKVKNSWFESNHSDSIDFDFVKERSVIEGNYFLNSGNDGVDISGTKMVIRGNVFMKSGDKGISVGEKSNATILNNVINGSGIGVAVKDLSRVKIVNNDIQKNKIGVAVYNKKKTFGGGYAEVYNTHFENNKMDFGVERINENDRIRSGKDKFKSDVSVSNSSFRSTGDISIELLAKPKKNGTKKALLRAYLRGEDIADYGYKYAVLVDGVESSELKTDLNFNRPIGLLNKMPSAKSFMPFISSRNDSFEIPGGKQ